MRRPACVYCGAPLSAEAAAELQAARTAEAAREARAQAAAAALEAPLEPAAALPRAAVVIDVAGSSLAQLAGALGLTPYEAGQRARRGGFQLHRLAAVAEAEAEGARLRGQGLRAWVFAEALLRARPVRVERGRLEGGVLRLQAGEQALTVRGEDLLLVVRGPITREYQTPPGDDPRRLRAASLTEGYRFHLHRRQPSPPLELDPMAFDFGLEGPVAGSSLLELAHWVETAAGAVPVDDGFRRLPPVLALAAPEEGDLAAALRERSRRPRGGEGPLVLDNLEDFRFYSAWQAAAARAAGAGAP